MSKGSHQQQTPPAEALPPSAPCILPIQNSLLMKYDPIKILSRPSLLATLGRKKVVESQPSLPVPVKSSLPTSTITSSQSCGNDKEDEDDDVSLMPPPRLPSTSRMARLEEEEEASTSMVPYMEEDMEEYIEGESPSTATKIVNVSRKQRKRGFPFIYPKVDLVKRKKGKVVQYTDDKNVGKCSAKDVRLSTISFALNQSQVGDQQKVVRMITNTDTIQCKMMLRKYTTNSKSSSTRGHHQTHVNQSSSSSAVNNDSSSIPTMGTKPQKQTEKGMKAVVKMGDKKAFSNFIPVRRKATPIKRRLRDIPSKIPENHLVNHTIALLRHKRELQTRLELIDEEGVVHRVDDLPLMKEPIPKGQLTIPNIPLTGNQTKQLLQNRLPILLAHGGYTHANEQPLEVLADVLEGFYMKMAHRLKQVREMEMSGCEQEFPDPLERVLVEMNLGGVRGVQKFYTSRVVDYRKRMEDQCIYLRKLYAHKIRLKVGMVTSSSGGNYSSSSSTSTSSHLISPGNSVLTEILSGLEGPMGSLNLFEEGKIRKLHQMPPPLHQIPPPLQLPPPPLQSSQPQLPIPCATVTRESQLNHPQQSPQLKQVVHLPPPPSYQNQLANSSKPLNHSNLSTQTLCAQSITSLGPAILQKSQQNLTGAKANPPQQAQHPLFRLENHHQKAVPANPMIGKINQPNLASPSAPTPSSMVSINLNNNVELGGFVPITSPGASRTPTLNVNKGIITCGSGDSKAKLKEALSQRNLLRLNFEQVPSSCDSTVLLSSSSPSLSSNNSQANKANTSSSSLSQTTRLKL